MALFKPVKSGGGSEPFIFTYKGTGHNATNQNLRIYKEIPFNPSIVIFRHDSLSYVRPLTILFGKFDTTYKQVPMLEVYSASDPPAEYGFSNVYFKYEDGKLYYYNVSSTVNDPSMSFNLSNINYTVMALGR